MNERPQVWYGAKARPFGQRFHLAWQGWLLDAIWFFSFIGISPFVRDRRHPFQSLGLMIGLVALFISIQHWKNQPRRWYG